MRWAWASDDAVIKWMRTSVLAGIAAHERRIFNSKPLFWCFILETDLALLSTSWTLNRCASDGFGDYLSMVNLNLPSVRVRFQIYKHKLRRT